MENNHTILAQLFPEIAPKTVENFVSLVNQGFYDGLIFHRVIPGFMIQGGDPLGNGMGGSKQTIPGEFSSNGFQNDLKHTRGVLSMARSMNPNSASSQFFIMHEDAPHLDGQYAAFGKVIDGIETVDEIAACKTNAQDRPLQDQRIQKIEVIEGSIKKEIDPLKDAGMILSKLPQGVLLTTKEGDKVNTMTIGWGTIGVDWSTPIFTAFVRLNRQTKGMLDRTMNFTINVPYQKDASKILSYCGTHSGRDVDKIQEMNLSLVEGETIDSPAIKELPLTLECKILYTQDQVLDQIPEPYKTRYYPQDVDGLNVGSNQDIHCMFVAKIEKAYILI